MSNVGTIWFVFGVSIIIIIIIIDNNETTIITINGRGMLEVALDHVQLSNVVGTIYLPSLPAIIFSHCLEFAIGTVKMTARELNQD